MIAAFQEAMKKSPKARLPTKPQHKWQRRTPTTAQERKSLVPGRKRLGFLDLPREIRDMIYHYVLIDDNALHRDAILEDNEGVVYDNPFEQRDKGFTLVDDWHWGTLAGSGWLEPSFDVPALAQTSSQLLKEVMPIYAQQHSVIVINEKYSNMPRTNAFLQRFRTDLLPYTRAVVIQFRTFWKDENEMRYGYKEAMQYVRNRWTNPVPWLKMEESLLAMGASKVIGIREGLHSARVWASACTIARRLRSRGAPWGEVKSMLEELDEMRRASGYDNGGHFFIAGQMDYREQVEETEDEEA